MFRSRATLSFEEDMMARSKPLRKLIDDKTFQDFQRKKGGLQYVALVTGFKHRNDLSKLAIGCKRSSGKREIGNVA